MQARQFGILLLVTGMVAAVSAGCESTAHLASPENPGGRAASPPIAAADEKRDSPAPADEPQNTATADMEQEVLNRINQIRQEQGLKPLRTHAGLTRIARGFSRKMAVENFFSHEAPSGETFEDRIRGARLDFARIGENIYKCYNTPKPAESAVKAWMNSAGHRHNILTAEFTETGIGVWKAGKNLYFTQDFIRPR